MHACTPLPGPWPGLRLWQVDLDQALPAGRLACLSVQERERAARFAFEHDRERYLRAHAALHALLAAAGAPAGPSGTVALDTGPWGKPSVRDARGLHFNLSHSAALAVVALSDGAEIGVDVEIVRPIPDAPQLAQAHFSDGEQAALRDLPADHRDLAFLRCWTRKEAVVKALGIGIGLDLRALDVGIGGAAARVQAWPSPDEQAELDLVSFALPQGAVVSIARKVHRAPVGRPVAQEEATA